MSDEQIIQEIKILTERNEVLSKTVDRLEIGRMKLFSVTTDLLFFQDNFISVTKYLSQRGLIVLSLTEDAMNIDVLKISNDEKNSLDCEIQELIRKKKEKSTNEQILS